MKLITLILSFMLPFSASAYELKTVIVEGYSKPWIAITADGVQATSILDARIHFHGWTQNPLNGDPYSKYDFSWKDEHQTPPEADLRRFVEAYGMQRSVEKNPSQMVLVPLSRGHNNQYPELFKISQFDLALTQVLQSLAINLNHFTVSQLSAHSGGGEILSRLLAQSRTSRYLSSVGRADFIDAIYGTASVQRLGVWISESSSRELNLFSIPKDEPAIHGMEFYQPLVGTESLTAFSQDGVRLQVTSKKLGNTNLVSLIQEIDQKLDHWSLVNAAWVY